MRFILPFIFSLVVFTAQSQHFEDGFPFNMPAGDSSQQRFLPEFPVEPIDGFVEVSSGGDFMVDGEKIKFWGFNTTTGGCFPPKEQAAGIAARLRKMGVNIIRFHHMDNPWSGQEGTILERSSNNTTTLNQVSLDRLHYFLYHLKRNGIYANINLHVSREMKEGDGIAGASGIRDYGKAVNMFDKEMIENQKVFARNLLNSVNPYTGLALKDDPVVAIVEISNENTLYGFWKSDLLHAQSAGSNLIQRHSDSLDIRFQTFLKNKYPSQAAFEQSWNTDISGNSTNMARDGGFESGDVEQEWIMELHDPAKANISIENNNPYEGNHCAKVEITYHSGVNWHVQFKQNQQTVEAGKTYRINFACRADQIGQVNVFAQRENAPYTWYGGRTINVEQNWNTYSFVFTAPEENNGLVRLGFSFLDQEGSFYFDRYEFVEEGLTGVESGESLAAGNVRRIWYGEIASYSKNRVADLAEFYIGIQRDYFDEMYAFLKNELGVKCPITGTNALSGMADAYTQEGLDFLDDHSYFDHPWFPNGWSLTDWYIENESSLKTYSLWPIGNVIPGYRLAKKPYTISEYNHPFPNRYKAEMMPALTSYASFHDIDGIMFFEYQSDHWDWESDYLDEFFAMNRDNLQMSLSPIYAYIFRNEIIQAGSRVSKIDYSKDYLYSVPRVDQTNRWGKYYPYDTRIHLEERVEINSYNGTGDPDLSILPEGNYTDLLKTSSNTTTLDIGKGLLMTSTPQFVCIAGELSQTSFVQTPNLEITGANDFGVVSWLSLTEEDLPNTKYSLLSLVNQTQNTNMLWDGLTSVHDNWGESPTLQKPLVIGLGLGIEADSIRLFPLHPDGNFDSSNYQTFLPIIVNRFLVGIDQNISKSLWYGIEAFGGNISRADDKKSSLELTIFPNPAKDFIWVEGMDLNEVDLEILDVNGKLVLKNRVSNVNGIFSLDISALPKGMYFLKSKTGRETQVSKFLKN
jgi:hypothetical protein